MYSFSTLSFFVDDLVKGLLDLASIVVASKGKSNLLPFVPVALVDGVSTIKGAGLCEKSLCGE
jgi:hypothetical protein